MNLLTRTKLITEDLEPLLTVTVEVDDIPRRSVTAKSKISLLI